MFVLVQCQWLIYHIQTYSTWDQYSPALLLAETAVLGPIPLLGEVGILLEDLTVPASVVLVVAVLLEPSSS